MVSARIYHTFLSLYNDRKNLLLLFTFQSSSVYYSHFMAGGSADISNRRRTLEHSHTVPKSQSSASRAEPYGHCWGGAALLLFNKEFSLVVKSWWEWGQYFTKWHSISHAISLSTLPRAQPMHGGTSACLKGVTAFFSLSFSFFWYIILFYSSKSDHTWSKNTQI